MTISLDKTTLTTITRPNFTFSQETITASTDTAEEDEDFEEINSVTAVIDLDHRPYQHRLLRGVLSSMQTAVHPALTPYQDTKVSWFYRASTVQKAIFYISILQKVQNYGLCPVLG